MISDSTLSTARNLCLIDIIDSDWEQDVLSDDGKTFGLIEFYAIVDSLIS